MPRNTIQHKFITTVVEGYTIEGGQPVPARYVLERSCNKEMAQAIIRKRDPSFSATEVHEEKALYKMSFDDFKTHATIVEE